MVQVKADGTIRSVLGPIKERVEIINDDGSLFGYFEPADSQEDAVYRQAALLFDPQEIEESANDQGLGSTTAEVLDRLNSLENS